MDHYKEKRIPEVGIKVPQPGPDCVISKALIEDIHLVLGRAQEALRKTSGFRGSDLEKEIESKRTELLNFIPIG